MCGMYASKISFKYLFKILVLYNFYRSSFIIYFFFFEEWAFAIRFIIHIWCDIIKILVNNREIKLLLMSHFKDEFKIDQFFQM